MSRGVKAHKVLLCTYQFMHSKSEMEQAVYTLSMSVLLKNQPFKMNFKAIILDIHLLNIFILSLIGRLLKTAEQF